MPAIRYEILLPLKYNDGRDIEPGKLLLMFLDLQEDSGQIQEFFRKFKEVLKERFQQLDVCIVAYPIRVI